jgi:16S rRNA (guanine966-N2)-methyltransferase
MKISGGRLKGRSINTPPIKNIRPSTEKTREAIFSALGEDIIDAEVADLFCGTGALGLEALSRGAKHALFVDSHFASTATTRENIQNLGLYEQSKVMTMNVFHVKPKHLQGIKIVFADPPYMGGYAQRLVELLSLQKFGWYGILILEHESEWQHNGEEFRLLRRLEFGETAVSILYREPPAADATTGEKGISNG